MNPTLWAFVLFVLALALVVLEVFVPSGGVLGVLALTSVVASVIMVFQDHGLDIAAYYLVGLVILVPIVVGAAIKWWPYTPIGRRVLNLVPGREREFAGVALYDKMRALVGQEGISVTVLIPSGAVRIGDRVYDAVAEGTPIEKGERVRVLQVEGTNIVVRRYETAEPSSESEPASEQPVNPDLLMEDPFA
jgi:membrane-bound serine protease (ClpP class)